MRIITPMIIITASLAYILGLLEPSMWAKAGRNLAIFISQLGFEESLLEEALAAAYETVLLSLVGVSLGTIIAYLASPPSNPSNIKPEALRGFQAYRKRDQIYTGYILGNPIRNTSRTRPESRSPGPIDLYIRISNQAIL
jgi:hypothetical protein